MDATPNFHEQVYEVVRRIPVGRVTTYGAIALYLHCASARAVGWALNHCHWVEPHVPAHRVVNRKGELSGRAHFHPPSRMEQLLVHEGVQVVNHQVIDFNEKFWSPE